MADLNDSNGNYDDCDEVSTVWEVFVGISWGVGRPTENVDADKFAPQLACGVFSDGNKIHCGEVFDPEPGSSGQ